MGENSKIIGEIGEDIVENFFKLIGWSNASKGETIKCINNKKHASKNSKKQSRTDHGVDFIYSYKSPLESSTVENIIISVKHTGSKYPANPKSQFKKHSEDLCFALECYKNSENKSKQMEKFSQINKNRDSGVLFWLSSDDNTYDNIIEKIANTRLDTDLFFDSFHVIDNKKMNFLYDIITSLRNIYSQDLIEFYYPGTSLSYVDKTIPRSGKICPVEFLSSPILPMKIKAKSDEDQDTLCLASSDSFDKDSLIRLMQAAREYTNEITSNIHFLYPDFTKSRHANDVSEAMSNFDQSFSEKVKVTSFREDYRSLANE